MNSNPFNVKSIYSRFERRKEKLTRFFSFFPFFSLARSLHVERYVFNELFHPQQQQLSTLDIFLRSLWERESIVESHFSLLFVDVVRWGNVPYHHKRVGGGGWAKEKEKASILWNVLCFEREFSPSPRVQWNIHLEWSNNKSDSRERKCFSST